MPATSPTLPYVTNDPTLAAPWRRITRFQKIPAWLLAFLLLTAFDALSIWSYQSAARLSPFWQQALYWLYPGPPASLPFALLLTLAIKRRGFIRNTLALLLVPAIVVLSHKLLINPRQEQFDAATFVGITRAATLLAAGILWTFARSPRAIFSMLRILFLAALIPILGIIFNDAQSASGTYHLWPNSWNFPFAVESYAEPFLIIALFFITLPWLQGNRRPSHKPRVEIPLSLATLAICFGSFAYLQTGRVALVAYFLPSNPYNSIQMVYWLYLTDHHITDEQVFRMLERETWKTPLPDASPLASRGWSDDWRRSAIERISTIPGAQDRLLKILMAHPHLAAAHYIAQSVADAKYYPAVPILLRYALFDADDECTQALESMKFPQVGWATLENSETIVMRDPTTGVSLNPERVDTNSDLKSLYSLGGSAKNDNDKPIWRLFVALHAPGRHPPFPDSACDQADQLHIQFARCIEAEDRAFTLYKSILPTPQNLFDKNKFRDAGGLFEPYPEYILNRLALAKLLGFHPPTGDFQSLAELTKNVDRYIAELATYTPPPSTAPATATAP